MTLCLSASILIEKVGAFYCQKMVEGEGDQHKVKLPRHLRQKATMTLQWLGDRLNMETVGSLESLLNHGK